MLERWRAVPRGVRVVAAVLIVVLAYGGVVHVVQLATGGWPPYGWAPAWLAVYFTALTVLDPLAAALLWARRAAGLYLAVAILVTDAAANAYAVYVLPGATATARASQAVITALAVAALVTAPRVRPWLAGRRDPVVIGVHGALFPSMAMASVQPCLRAVALSSERWTIRPGTRSKTCGHGCGSTCRGCA